MKYDFIRCAAMIPTIKVADCQYNEAEIIRLMDSAASEKAEVIVFPELCLTGYTCQDLFLWDTLIESAYRSLIRIAQHSEGLNGIFFVGAPIRYQNKLYNCAVAICNGNILGIVPKTFLPNYS